MKNTQIYEVFPKEEEGGVPGKFFQYKGTCGVGRVLTNCIICIPLCMITSLCVCPTYCTQLWDGNVGQFWNLILYWLSNLCDGLRTFSVQIIYSLGTDCS